jgi:thiol-disulfide isomerase/thioredoxin
MTTLYFRSDYCAPWVTQARFLQELQAEFGGRVAIEKIDVEIESQKARSYGVFTLPTTLIVDRTGTTMGWRAPAHWPASCRAWRA